MIVNVYPVGGGSAVELGSIQDGIWVQGFKLSHQRSLQLVRPINAPTPTVLDRIMRVTTFSFTAGRTLPDIGAAMLFMGSHPNAVYNTGNIQFTEGSYQTWLNGAGIERVELIDKRGCLVVFSYSIQGGVWSNTQGN